MFPHIGHDSNGWCDVYVRGEQQALKQFLNGCVKQCNAQGGRQHKQTSLTTSSMIMQQAHSISRNQDTMVKQNLNCMVFCKLVTRSYQAKFGAMRPVSSY